jgi:hypothetical protein
VSDFAEFFDHLLQTKQIPTSFYPTVLFLAAPRAVIRGNHRIFRNITTLPAAIAIPKLFVND